MRTMETIKSTNNVWEEIFSNGATCSECGCQIFGLQWYNSYYGMFICQCCVSNINSQNLKKYN